MQLQLIKAFDMKQMPWKNGGGITSEIAISPAASRMDQMDFDWRVSIATVSSDGPFSIFPGYDRWLVVWSGAGLEINGTKHQMNEPFQFKGEMPMEAKLASGPVKDFGIIFKRDHVRAAMAAHTLPEDETLKLSSQGECFVLCTRGELRIGEFYLNPGDVIRAQSAADLQIKALAQANFVTVEVSSL